MKTYVMLLLKTKYFLLFEILIFLGMSLEAQVAGISAAAGEDKIICLSQQGVQIGDCQFEGYTYKWTSTPHDPDFDDDIPFPIVSPSISTTYELSISGGYCSPCSDIVHVIVIEDLLLTVEDNLDGSECMEGRKLTFYVEIDAVIPVGLSSDILNSEIIEFVYQIPGGTVRFQQPIQDGFFSEHDYLTPDVGINGGRYNLLADAYFIHDEKNICSSSNSVHLEVVDFSIEFFGDAISGKNWKIGIGRDIGYSAFGSIHAYDWEWEFFSMIGNELVWHSPKGNRRYVGEPGAIAMKIPYSDLTNSGNLRAHNDWFGSTYSEIGVSAKNGDGDFLFAYETASPIEVFFEPDKGVDGNSPTASSPPMWYVYWRDGNVVEGLEDFEYDHSLPYCSLYRGGFYNDFRIGKDARTDNCRKFYELLIDGAYQLVGADKYHIDLVAASISHEYYHQQVFLHWNPLPNNIHDADEDDIPGGYEENPGVFNSVHLRPEPMRTYFPISDSDNSNSFEFPSDDPGEVVYIGREDQEVRCKIEEMLNPVRVYKGKDWSISVHNPNWGN